MILRVSDDTNIAEALRRWQRLAPATPLRVPDLSPWRAATDHLPTSGPYVRVTGPLPVRPSLAMRDVPERDRFADLLERALAGSPDPRLTSTTALLERSGPIEWSGCGVLRHAEQDVGVVMTVRLGPRLGGLIAVGLFPAYRGRGLGRAAFATGWALLARRGMTEVVDEVLLSNHAALAILTDAGLKAEPPYLLVHPTPG